MIVQDVIPYSVVDKYWHPRSMSALIYHRSQHGIQEHLVSAMKIWSLTQEKDISVTAEYCVCILPHTATLGNNKALYTAYWKLNILPNFNLALPVLCVCHLRLGYSNESSLDSHAKGKGSKFHHRLWIQRIHILD